MAIPEFNDLKLPLLKLFSSVESLSRKDIYSKMSAVMKMTSEDLAETISSGQSKFLNRVGWALTDLKQAGLLVSPARAHYAITSIGRQVLNENPPCIDREYLMKFPEFKKFLERSRELKGEGDGSKVDTISVDSGTTPEERISVATSELHAALASELIEVVRGMDPYRFEHLVVDLMLKLGYGGTHMDSGLVTQKSGDGGIDGIIRQDRLGLESIYLQAKRWTGAKVSRPEVQSFVGALHGRHATKGVFITTSEFTADAIEYVRHSQLKVVLIDGKKLAELMIENDLGVSPLKTVVIKRIDSDYFAD